MPGKKKDTETQVTANVFSTEEATRKNIPEAGMVDYEPKGLSKSKTYCWDPRESPQLIWAGKAGMKKVEVEEQASLEVPTVNLHIHERVAPEAIIRSLKREDVQRSLFADPVMDFKEEVKFYQHEVNWSNRMILGDSLLVMNSLLEREGMRGSVQCIYMDPPYGIKFGSNFQPRIDKRDVKDGADDDLSREVEVVQAFRDTWELGIHSYLSYMRDRLIVARELLKDEGSIFVQIGDENVHRVRCLMDEVFGEENFMAQFLVKKKGSQMGNYIDPVNDYILWYARSPKDEKKVKYRQLYLPRELDAETVAEFSQIEYAAGVTGKWANVPDATLGAPSDATIDARNRPAVLFQFFPSARPFRSNPFTSGYERANQSLPFTFQGKTYAPGAGKCWKTTVRTEDGSTPGIERLAVANRLLPEGTLAFKRYLSDFPFIGLTNWWDGLGGASNPQYVVQTNTELIQRCILMTTDPGDLVLDPTCGSGTTAYVAEQWGRRWITCDTSRVALAIARHRLMTASFDYYKLRFPAAGISGGFKYKTVPHITLKSIAQNKEIDEIANKWQPQIDEALAAINGGIELRAEVQEWMKHRGYWPHLKEWQVPRSIDEVVNRSHEYPGSMLIWQTTIEKFWSLKRAMQAEIDASIQRNAPQEELVDQPETERNIVRVSGPFTMEAIPDTAEISMEVEHIPGDGEAENAVPGLDIAVFGSASQAEATNAGAYIADMIEKLRKSGVHARGKGKFEFASLRPLSHEVLHAEGEIIIKNGVEKQLRCAVLFGAQNGAISETHVKEGMAAGRRYDAVLFCGYDFTATAQDMVNEHRDKDWLLMMSYISPDTVMGDLLKDTKAAQLFTLVGEPDVVVYSFADPDLAALVKDAAERKVPEVAARAASLKEGEVFVELRGVDLYNPVSGETSSDHGAGVHAIFLDHDYDGKSFCICQALFPNKKDSWDKIARSLKGSLDVEALDAMRTCVSLPFKVGKEGRIQVKVIDARGNSVVKTVRVKG